jgi:hypothetical protein
VQRLGVGAEWVKTLSLDFTKGGVYAAGGSAPTGAVLVFAVEFLLSRF